MAACTDCSKDRVDVGSDASFRRILVVPLLGAGHSRCWLLASAPVEAVGPIESTTR